MLPLHQQAYSCIAMKVYQLLIHSIIGCTMHHS